MIFAWLVHREVGQGGFVLDGDDERNKRYVQEIWSLVSWCGLWKEAESAFASISRKSVMFVQ